MNKSGNVNSGKQFLITMLHIYPIKRIFLSMLRPSSISSVYAALSVDVPLEDKKRYMKIEREIIPDTKELYNFISCGYKVLIAGLEIDRVKQRIEDPKHFYTEHPDFKHIVDKIWIIIIKKDINKVADSMSTDIEQLESPNTNWHKRYCIKLTSTCKCNETNSKQLYRPLLNKDSTWYTSSEFREDNILLYYHPGKDYVLAPFSTESPRAYINLRDDDIRSLSSYGSNNFSNIQYIDIEDDDQRLQFSKPESSVSKECKEIRIYFLTYRYMGKIVYI